MLLFIEGYPYNLNAVARNDLTVRDVLKEVVAVPQKEEQYAFEYVGYCYSRAAKDVVFFLPKVVLTGERDENDNADTIFGASPQDIIDFDANEVKDRFTEEGSKQYKEFLSTLAIWIYRTISVYKQTNNDNILESKELQTESRGRKQKHNTLLDVIIALRDFNRRNQDYFTFIARNAHSGYNKIQWAKTINRTAAIMQGGRPIYISPVNKKKEVNFDEELIVIYFSILNYVHQVHGFTFDINFNYNLISPDTIKRSYIERNMGCRRLRQIKYKYFSDKALRIWDLCYAFFDREYKIAMNRNEEDYLLARDFDHIFETMIDCLVSGDEKSQLPQDLTNQRDGKLVDHMFIGQGLIEQSDLPAEPTYYIGDSKYYKRSKDDRTLLGSTSIYKQYTYARNVIQWNMNLFLGLPGVKEVEQEQPQLRDSLTEGYNLIPNFFISARIPSKKKCEEEGKKFLSFDDDTLKAQEEAIQLNRQFENRLFDRDTLLLCHYDVNFLYIVSLYGRDNKNKQNAWRNNVRQEFRKSIQDTLNKLFSFYTLQPCEGMDCYKFIKEHFHQLNGKLYRPQESSNYLILALMKSEGKEVERLFGETTKEALADNESLKTMLESHFVSKPFELGNDLSIPSIGTFEPLPPKQVKKDKVLLVMMENFESKSRSFLPHGVLAVGLKDTPDSQSITDNMDSIGYVLFHTRKDDGQHLYVVDSANGIVGRDQIGDVYANVRTTDRYLIVQFRSELELPSDMLHSSKMPYERNTRYDSQLAALEDLR